MAHLIVNLTSASTTIFFTQVNAHSITIIDDVTVINNIAFANPFTTRPAAVVLIVTELADHRTTLFLPGNKNLGGLCSYLTLHSDNIYRSHQPVYLTNQNVANRQIEFLFLAPDGSQLVFSVGTSCVVKISLK